MLYPLSYEGLRGAYPDASPPDRRCRPPRRGTADPPFRAESGNRRRDVAHYDTGRLLRVHGDSDLLAAGTVPRAASTCGFVERGRCRRHLAVHAGRLLLPAGN
ncbi:hypothetical protein GCM10009772_01030 [Pseudonocardia alni subsp. carboxydivorans]